MPRQYTRKTTWGKTPLEEMESATAEKNPGKHERVGETHLCIKENDVAHVPKSEVVKKLPQHKRPGGTTQREQLLIFPCNLQGWNVE
ncbi:hypothetical protein QQF64_020487 [Cirrhinus molitorella]|uniref:Uncharacterized protein n=1 Tax=Cirrhinus molitorella TaxID=172907 RepID=A0ABR3L9B4_9TELE